MSLKLNIGCGPKEQKGWTGIDMEDFGHNIVRDLTKGLPFSDESVDEIKAEHIFEHILDLEFVISECYRILKKGGKMKVVCPHKTHERALVPFHVRLIDEGTFEYLELGKGWQIKEMVINDRKDIHVWLIKPE